MANDYKHALAQLYPPVSYNINGKQFLAQCEVDGKVFQRLEQRATEVLNVINPETSGQMLADWERICGIKTDTQKTYTERVKRVILQLNAIGGLSIPILCNWLKALAIKLRLKNFHHCNRICLIPVILCNLETNRKKA